MYISCEDDDFQQFSLSFLPGFMPRTGEYIELDTGVMYVVERIKHYPDRQDIKMFVKRVN